jgi:DNA-directed RNA polymerase subunit RPC12/RpoP
MPSVLYCRCPNCSARVILEQIPNRGLSSEIQSAQDRTGREACPYCRTVFVPESYRTIESDVDLEV